MRFSSISLSVPVSSLSSTLSSFFSISAQKLLRCLIWVGSGILTIGVFSPACMLSFLIFFNWWLLGRGRGSFIVISAFFSSSVLRPLVFFRKWRRFSDPTHFQEGNEFLLFYFIDKTDRRSSWGVDQKRIWISNDFISILMQKNSKNLKKNIIFLW